MKEYEINTLIKLAKKDPKKFDQLTRKMIENEISLSSSKRQIKLKRIQWKIDVEKMKFKGKQIEFASNIFGIMWDKFSELNTDLQMFRKTTSHINSTLKTKNKKRTLKIIKK